MAIGTSGKVYPAAGFVRQAWKAHKIEVNLQSSDVSADFDDHRVGAASTEVTMLVDQILSGTLKSV
jgi:NAD-dependent deacetylase